MDSLTYLRNCLLLHNGVCTNSCYKSLVSAGFALQKANQQEKAAVICEELVKEFLLGQALNLHSVELALVEEYQSNKGELAERAVALRLIDATKRCEREAYSCRYFQQKTG